MERVDKGDGSQLLGLGIESLDRWAESRPRVLIIALTMTFLGLLDKNPRYLACTCTFRHLNHISLSSINPLEDSELKAQV